MGTRSGDVDPAVVLHLIDSLGYTSKGVNDLLNKQCDAMRCTPSSCTAYHVEAAENIRLC